MGKKPVLVLLILFSLLLTSGCKDKVRIPKPLVSSQTSYNTFDVTTAIGPDGKKHFAWSECNSAGRCHIVYTFTYLGEAHPFIYYNPYQSDPSYEPEFRYPDIAVGGDGYVYLVWHYIQEEGVYYDCWNMIDSSGTPLDTNCGILQSSMDVYSTQDSHPQVAALDNMAFAVFEQVTETGEALYYIKLRTFYDGVRGRVSSISPGYGSSLPQMALSSYDNGGTPRYVVHVLWTSLGGVGSATTYYNDSYGAGPDMNMGSPVSDSLSSARSHPVLGVDQSNGQVIGLFFIHTPVNNHNLKAVYCPTVDCKSSMTWKSDILSPATGWSQEGFLGMAIQSNTAYFSFTATTTALRAGSGFSEVFTGSYHAGDTGALNVNQVTSKAINKSSPKTIRLDFGSGNGMTITAWREYAGGGAYYDGYIYVQSIVSYTQKVFEREHATPGGTFDLAAHGDWACGILNAQIWNETDRIIPWYTLNVESANLATIRKP